MAPSPNVVFVSSKSSAFTIGVSGEKLVITVESYLMFVVLELMYTFLRLFGLHNYCFVRFLSCRFLRR